MTKPHKHAEIIKAWADGAEIEIKANSGEWHSVGLCPGFYPDCEYRIKPAEKVVRWLWVYKNASNLWRISTRYLTEDEAATFYRERKKLDFTEMEFDE